MSSKTTIKRASSRSVSRILSSAGFQNARVRNNPDCSYTVPSGASGYACRDMITGPWLGLNRHKWPSVEISWYGDTRAPFAEMAGVLADHEYAVGPVDPQSINSGRPSITVWREGADYVDEEVDEDFAAAQTRFLGLMRESGYDEYYRPIPVADMHGATCPCPWCESERLTYCLLTRDAVDHLDHRIVGCPQKINDETVLPSTTSKPPTA